LIITQEKNHEQNDFFLKKIDMLRSQANDLLIMISDFAYEVEQDFWDEVNQESFLAAGRKGGDAKMAQLLHPEQKLKRVGSSFLAKEGSDVSNASPKSQQQRRKSTTLFHTGNVDGTLHSLFEANTTTTTTTSPQSSPKTKSKSSLKRRVSSVRFVGNETSESNLSSKQKASLKNLGDDLVIGHVDSSSGDDDEQHHENEDQQRSALAPGAGPPEGALARIRTFVERGLFQLDTVLSKALPEPKFEEFPELFETDSPNSSKRKRKAKSNNNNNGDGSDEEEEGTVKMQRDVRYLFGSSKNLGDALQAQQAKDQQVIKKNETERNQSPSSSTRKKKDSENASEYEPKFSKPLPPGLSDNTFLMSAAAILNSSSAPSVGQQASNPAGSGSRPNSATSNSNHSHSYHHQLEDRRYTIVLSLVATILDALLHRSDSNQNILQQSALEIERIMDEMKELKAETLEHVLARDEALGELTFALEEIQGIFRCASRVSVHIQDEGVFRGIVRTFVAASRRMQDFARDIARIGEIALLEPRELRQRMAKAKPDHEMMIVALLELADAIETQPVSVPRHAQWRRKALDELYWNLQSALSTLSTLELAGDEIAEEIVNTGNNNSNAVAMHIRKLIVEEGYSMDELAELYLTSTTSQQQQHDYSKSIMKGTALAIAARRKLREMGRAMDKEWGFSCW
jgi:hypothetical protein